MVHNAMWDAIIDYHMDITAENVVKKYGITRQELDEFAVASVEEIDTNMRLGANQSMGPRALGDLIRLYVVLAILNAMRRKLETIGKGQENNK